MDKKLRLFGALLAIVAAPAVGRPVEDAPVKEEDRTEEPARFMRSVEEPGRSMALEIAARTFVGSSPGAPAIVLVGVSHIGERRLYSGLQDLLDGQDVVLYESVKPAGTGGAGGADDAERVESTREALRFLAAVLAVHRELKQEYPEGMDELAGFAAAIDPRLAEWVAGARTDAWGRAVAYRREGDGTHFVLTSLGGDRQPGGTGAGADLVVTSETGVEPLDLGGEERNRQSELARALGLEFRLDGVNHHRFRTVQRRPDRLLAGGPAGDHCPPRRPLRRRLFLRRGHCRRLQGRAHRLVQRRGAARAEHGPVRRGVRGRHHRRAQPGGRR
ncbi:MAG: type II secretion system protein GspG [Planctomycetota bacterium]|jgi:hypothetical protein